MRRREGWSFPRKNGKELCHEEEIHSADDVVGEGHGRVCRARSADRAARRVAIPAVTERNDFAEEAISEPWSTLIPVF